jgi:multiple sugar transport system substrate-binding protein
MEVTGFWNISTLKESGLEWDIAPLWSGEQPAVPAFGSGLAVSSKSEHKGAAADLVAFLTSLEGQRAIASSGVDVPANLEAIADPAFQGPDWNTSGVDLSAFTEATANIFAPPLVPEWNEIQKAFTDGMTATWTGDQSVADGLATVQATLESVLG